MSRYLKLLFRGVFYILALPMSILFFLLASISNKDATFSGFSQAVSLIPGKIGVYFRAAFYSTVCKNVHRDIVIGFSTIFSHYDIEIEEGVYIGPQCNIGMCKIGKKVHIGSGVHILSGLNQHYRKKGDIETGVFEKINIGNNCWIGNSSCVAVNLCCETTVGLGTVVHKCTGDAKLVVGHGFKIYE